MLVYGERSVPLVDPERLGVGQRRRLVDGHARCARGQAANTIGVWYCYGLASVSVQVSLSISFRGMMMI